MSESLAPLAYVLLPVAGFVAGVVNTVAGGGSFLTLPVLLLTGMPEQVANGTNRVAVALQSLYAVPLYHRRQPIELTALPKLLPVSLAGLGLGAWLATHLSADSFRGAMGSLFLGFVALMLVRPKLLLQGRSQRAPPAVRLPALFLVGVYGGFLQAGVGILLLLLLSLLEGRDLKQANGLKLAIVAVWILPVVVFFALSGQVRWLPGLLVGAGNMVGARLGVRLAAQKGNRLIFFFVIGVMSLTGVRLVWRALS